ncbi:4Fe-4S dicluster domain-containing protein [Adlercreutzia sp. ZJ138]|uniref:4Fe-4S dicluster domain-containing protein n=1 Tax=Adlercreutzia sp. ZJ138 TaxID=2709405 RepID=UPI0013EB83AA|nr:4Fe-4S dicluster domain-containing protein [Adlercreutzia sp. ZJ138]
MRYGLAIDTKRCIGCHTCAVQCRNENNVPKKVWWNRVITVGAGEYLDEPDGEFPNCTMTYYTVSCQHCDNPACVKVCPVGATYKDPETGIVRQDYDKCIGCRMCMAACPYTGVRSFNWEEPQYLVDFSFGDEDVPVHQKHVVEKCTMCYHRIARGQEPACIAACPARARCFGDLDDPDSEISKQIASRSYEHLLEDRGTQPSVYYLV